MGRVWRGVEDSLWFYARMKPTHNKSIHCGPGSLALGWAYVAPEEAEAGSEKKRMWVGGLEEVGERRLWGISWLRRALLRITPPILEQGFGLDMCQRSIRYDRRKGSNRELAGGYLSRIVVDEIFS